MTKHHRETDRILKEHDPQDSLVVPIRWQCRCGKQDILAIQGICPACGTSQKEKTRSYIKADGGDVHLREYEQPVQWTSNMVIVVMAVVVSIVIFLALWYGF